MRNFTLSSLFIALILGIVPIAHAISHAGIKIYLGSAGGGFETYIAAAITKKHVPVTIVGDP